MSDVLLLADIFENFKNICMNHYGLDPAWYLSTSGLPWDIALKITNANNPYSWAMLKQLPTSGFKWMTDDELDDWEHLSCILEVDLEYPEQLHNLHNDYPLAPERVKIGNIDKLIPNLNKKPITLCIIKI